MGIVSKISWTDATYNPWVGCTKVSPGCDHCYAETLSERWGRDFSNIHRSSPATFNAPLRWKEVGFVFTCSMSDFFIREADPWREEAWDIMRRTPHLTYQVLTKRPGLAVAWHKAHGWLPNIWLGTSVESTKYLPRLDVLARVPAPVRFISAEPLLGPLSLTPWLVKRCDQIDQDGEQVSILNWCILGGESGPHARPMRVEWAEAIRQQCQIAGVPLWVKQDSGPYPGMQGRLPDELWAVKERP